jgi:hypothetical protein
LDITLETQKFRVRNPLNQELHFCIENTLKLAYKHLEVKKIFRVVPPRLLSFFKISSAPWTPRFQPRRGGKGGEGKGGEGRGREATRGGKGRRGEKGREGEKECGPPVKIPLKRLWCLIYLETTKYLK